MLRDRIYDYYVTKDCNCSEALLHAANDEYQLGLQDDDFRFIGGFGAGFGCGRTCGVLCAGVAAISLKFVTGRAHTTEDLNLKCTAYVDNFMDLLGSDNCDHLRDLHHQPEPDIRCIETVMIAADALEKTMNELKA